MIDQDTYDFDRCAEDVANERGQIVVYPKENQVQLDFDNQESFDDFFDILESFRKGEVKHEIEVKPSRSGLPHRHVTLTFLDGTIFDEPKRILFQLALGSDPIREKLNAMRYFQGVPNPSRLFENP